MINFLISHSVMSDSLRPMDCSMPGFPVLQYLTEFAQTHVYWISDAIQPSHSLCWVLGVPPKRLYPRS